MSAAPRTLYDKLWDEHVVRARDDGMDLIWIDRHLIHEVSSPQAFEGLRQAGRRARRPDLTLAVADHNVPTEHRDRPIADAASATQVALLERNAGDFGIRHFGMADPDRGIVHVVGPERGFTLPGLTLVCGDSHTATHGALGALSGSARRRSSTSSLPRRPGCAGRGRSVSRSPVCPAAASRPRTWCWR